VLVVEDDHGLRDVLARGLRAEGFDTMTSADGRGALERAIKGKVHAVVLDIGLPDADGRDLCAALRAHGVDAPVLFLSARDGLTDRLSGFSSGGDDYLSKPFAFPELVARLRALVRRGADPATTAGDLRLDPATHDLASGGRTIPVSPTEFRLLARLLAAPGEVVRRRELIAAAWPAGAIVAENTLDQYVTRLRRKLAEVGSSRSIDVVRGVGFRVGDGDG
jgi:two-component system response regulator MprA